MIEKVFELKKGDEDVFEKIFTDENMQYTHIIFVENGGLQEHYTDSHVYMTILRGIISINIADQGIHEYGAGTMLSIPKDTKMHPQNLHPEAVELIIVKVPAPKEV